MTECPAFLFIFLPGSISEQRGPGRSPSPALRAPDLSRPPYRSEHLQNRPASAAPLLIKATIHLPATSGRGDRPGAGGGGEQWQTDPTDSKEFRETTAGHTNHHGPSGPGVRKENQRAASAAGVPGPLPARPLQARPGSRPHILVLGVGSGGATQEPSSKPPSQREPQASPSPTVVWSLPRLRPTSQGHLSVRALATTIIFEIIIIVLFLHPLPPSLGALRANLFPRTTGLASGIGNKKLASEVRKRED